MDSAAEDTPFAGPARRLTDDPEVIARIVPQNEAAKAAFHELAVHQEQGLLHEYHSRFICVEGFAQKDSYSSTETEEEYPASAGDGPAAAAAKTQFTPDPEQLTGHFVLSLRIAPALASGVGWRLGKGTSRFEDRSVDILVISPGRSSTTTTSGGGRRPAPAKTVATVQASLQLHRDSGVLMLSAGSERRSVDLAGDAGWIRLVAPERHVLHRPVNRFRVGPLEFTVEYSASQQGRRLEDYRDFVRARNEYMLRHFRVSAPHPHIPAVPRPADVELRRDLLIFGTIGAGAFGTIRAAVDRHSGEPLAVKDVLVKRRQEAADLLAEFEIGSSFLDVSCTPVLSSSQSYSFHSFISLLQLVAPLPLLFPHLSLISCHVIDGSLSPWSSVKSLHQSSFLPAKSLHRY